jgi:hypothetical protein
MILKPTQRKSFERALASAKGVEERLAFLEQLASTSPQLRDRVAQLRTRQTYLITLAEQALAADSASE